MATINLSLRSHGITSHAKHVFMAIKLKGTSQFVHKNVRPPQQQPHRVKKSMFANSATHRNLQTHFMPSSEFRADTDEASDIVNDVMSPTLEVGVGVFILNNGEVLFGRRRSLSIAANVYAIPGGHLEFGESFEKCAAREVKEETGLDIKNIELLTTTNNVLSDTLHLQIIYVRANLSDPNQIPQNIEPDRCVGWEWHDLKNLPKPMFEPLRSMLQGGFTPFPANY